VYIRRYVPETKGFTLEQIEEYFLRISKGKGRAGAGSDNSAALADADEVQPLTTNTMHEDDGHLKPLI
jgi:hypothetical protein